jgi:hypothetical protein
MSCKMPWATASFVPVRAARTSPFGAIFNGVVQRTDRFGPVRYHQIAVFAFELGEGAEAVVFGFKSKADDPARALASAKRGDDIVGFDEMQIHWVPGLGDLVIFDADWAVVAGRGGTDQAIAVFKFARRGGKHVLRRDHRYESRGDGVFDFDGPTYYHDVMPQRERRFTKCLAHAATRRVGEVPHRIKVLTRGTGGNKDSGHNCF